MTEPGATDDVAVPDIVERLAAGRPFRPVWLNELGGRTFVVGAGAPELFVKWMPPGGERLTGGDLLAERDRMLWALPFTPVPVVVEAGTNADGAWLATRPLAGESAVSRRWTAQPERAVRAVASGLRALHDRLPVESCPFSWSVTDRLARAGRPVDEAFARIGPPPPIDRLVVCHGDACMPNTLVDDHGRWSGHVDLGRLGVADRWADLATGRANTVGNLGPGYEDLFLEAYGVDADEKRLRYYRELGQID